MKRDTNLPFMTCEQVYQVWSTEPDLLQVMDLRSKIDFEGSHIPGALHLSKEELKVQLSRLAGRLGVIVAPDHLKEWIKNNFQPHKDIVIMSDCHRWSELQQQNQTIGALMPNSPELIFQQLFEPETSTYTYIIADALSGEAAIIDPVRETVERDLGLLKDLNLRLMYVLDTHVHADHVTGASRIKDRTGAKIGLSREAQATGVDIPLEDGQVLTLGNKKIQVISTPGHTNTCVSYYFEGMVFTGDALLIRGSGRTDFQQGSAEVLYQSVTEKIFSLPDCTIVYPGHDYRGLTSSTVGMEKLHNPRLGGGASQQDFVKTMSELKLAHPKQIKEAVKANLTCGRTLEGRHMHPQIVDGMPEVSVFEVHAQLGQVRIIDVRRVDEFHGELHHIPGAELVTLGPDLEAFLENNNKDEEIVFACRSGGRSGQATALSLQLGYRHTMNMVGGMLRWNEESLPVE
jgi:sulfur dioxygenase